MRYEKKQPSNEETEFLDDIQKTLDSGVKNAVFMSINSEGDIALVPLQESRSIETIGLIESAKTIFMADVLEIEED